MDNVESVGGESANRDARAMKSIPGRRVIRLSVAVAMIASYFVSMAVTPVACRYFMGHAEPGRLGRWVAGLIERLAGGYAHLLRRVLPFRGSILAAAAVLVVGSAWAATRLPSTFFPEIDEGMDMIYVRFTPGIALADASQQLNAMGAALERWKSLRATTRMIAAVRPLTACSHA